VLKEIKIQAGATVQVNTVVGVIDADGAGASTSAPQASAAQPAPQASAPQNQAAPAKTQPAPQANGTPTPKQPPATEAAPAAPSQTTPAPQGGGDGGPGTDVLMPQMGESIFEGTITKWLKKVGDKVQRDEPLFEISTDKVDAEIPAPTTGVLREIKVNEGATVQVNSVVAVIGGAGTTAGGAGTTAGGAGAPAAAKPAAQPAAAPQPAPAQPQRVPESFSVAAREEPVAQAREEIEETEGREGVRSSPLVRRIARENNIDLGRVPGTGLGGRISKQDILSFIQQHGPGGAGRPQPVAPPPAPPIQRAPQPQVQPAQQQQAAYQAPPAQQVSAVPQPLPELAGEFIPMTAMRKKIADRMVESRRTSAHVHTIFKVDMTRIVKMREQMRKGWEARHGVKLTFMPFIAKALMHGIRTKPVVNSSVINDGIQYHKNVNIGIAVALEWGLIVPVVKGAENLSFVGLQRAITDLGERARGKKLKPDDVQGGTITITNPGIYGPQFGTPIILQPQVAILGMGGIFKEPTVITDKDGNDSIAIRHILRLVLGYDHRIIDGADADQFMVAVRDYLENFKDDIG
jgi:pyruvate dehydrogenase E2 component (dihydrolipoamide acetyltransferase)